MGRKLRGLILWLVCATKFAFAIQVQDSPILALLYD